MGKVLYRAVKSNSSDDVIAIGYDEKQGGKDYNNGEGTWCNFTFSQIPEPGKELVEYAEKNKIHNLCKIVNGEIVLKTISELQK